MPIHNSHGTVIGVAMMINSTRGLGVFDDDDVELLEVCCKHIGISMYCHELFELTLKCQRQSEIMFDVSRALSFEMETKPMLRTIMDKLTELVDCDRCNVFVVDRTSGDLWSLLWNQDMQVEDGDNTPTAVADSQRRRASTHDADNHSVVVSTRSSAGKYRIPMKKGIAGYVAMTGKLVNIRDAYEDPRFNREIDMKTGYRTRTVLCVPIRGPQNKDDVIGCVQLINKLDGVFEAEDEQIVSAFAAHIGITLQNSTLYDEAVEAQRRHYNLLRKMLPAHIVDKLNQGETCIAEPHEQLFVLFSDIGKPSWQFFGWFFFHTLTPFLVS
jgi:GAF domain-containing protein